MADDRTFGLGDLVPSIPWWRRLSDRVAALAIKATPPLFRSWTRAGTKLDYLPWPRFNAVILSGSGPSYVVAEVYYVPATRAWALVTGGRTVTAFEYNGATGLEIGTNVEVVQNGIGEWRFWLSSAGVRVAPGPPCDPCPLPIDMALTLYFRYLQANYHAVIEADDEYTSDLNWSALAPPFYNTNFSPAQPYFKAGYYYSDCLDVQIYANDGPDGTVVAFGVSVAVRFFLACDIATGLIKFFGRAFVFSSVYSGDAECAAFDPTAHWDATANYPFDFVEVNWEWNTTKTCNPFELREKKIVYVFIPPSTYTPVMTRDIWIYPT